MSSSTFAPKPLTNPAPLTKSKYVHGVQCPLYVWLEVRTDAPRPQTDAFTQALFDAGDEVGEYARKRWDAREVAAGRPPGTRVTDDPRLHGQAVRETADALAAGARVIHEAAFTEGGVRVRVDVLERLDDGTFALHEVKSTGDYDKNKHLADVAVQAWVVRRAGLRVSKADVVHLNKAYEWPGGDYDLEALFVEHDATADVDAKQAEVTKKVAELLDVLRCDAQPIVPVDTKCTSPYGCPYQDVCPTRGEDVEHPISELPNCKRGQGMHKAVTEAGVHSLLELGDEDAERLLVMNKSLHTRWYNTWKATKTGERVVVPECADWVRSLTYPIYHLDFETTSPPLPLVPGTRPFERVPLQYSIHVEHEDGTIEVPNRAFFADANDPDPRRSLIEQLLADLGETGTILQWSSYEASTIRMLAENPKYRTYAARLMALIDRIEDLGKAIDDYVYDKDFHGRWSVKVVHPVLAKDSSVVVHEDTPVLSYDDLDGCAKGDQAAIMLIEYLRRETTEERRAAIREEMLTYCGMDTQAMVDVLRVVRGECDTRYPAS